MSKKHDSFILPRNCYNIGLNNIYLTKTIFQHPLKMLTLGLTLEILQQLCFDELLLMPHQYEIKIITEIFLKSQL